MVFGVGLIGGSLAKLLIGGNQIGQPTLTRFYALHVAVLPLTLVLVLAAFRLLGAHGTRHEAEGDRQQGKPKSSHRRHSHTRFPWLQTVPRGFHAQSQSAQSVKPSPSLSWYQVATSVAFSSVSPSQSSSRSLHRSTPSTEGMQAYSQPSRGSPLRS